MKIGFIGLGNLGTPIARNILTAGHELYIFNRTASKTKALADEGATACNSIGELAKSCNIVCTMVSDDNAIKAVSEELLQHLAKDSLHISMSTILPATAATLAEQHSSKGLRYLAAPVFGRPEAAEAKKLNYVISGNKADRKTATPLLEDSGGAGVWDFGDVITAANTVKLCGNFSIAAAMEAIGESAALAQKSGVDPHKMWDMFGQTLFNTPLYQNYSKIILERKFEPAAFNAKLGLKDMNLINQQAANVSQAMPLGSLLKTNMETLVTSGREQLDWSAVSLGGQPS